MKAKSTALGKDRGRQRAQGQGNHGPSKKRSGVGKATAKANTGRWSKMEHDNFLQGMRKFPKEWRSIANLVATRTILQVRTHAQKWFSSHKMEGNLNTTKRKWHVDSDYLEVDRGSVASPLGVSKVRSIGPIRTPHDAEASKRARTSTSTPRSEGQPDGPDTQASAQNNRQDSASVDLPLDRTATAAPTATAAANPSATGRRLYDFEALSSAASYCIKKSDTLTSSSSKNSITHIKRRSEHTATSSTSCVHVASADANAQAAAALLSMTCVGIK